MKFRELKPEEIEWVKGYEGLYAISKSGIVFNRHGKTLKAYHNKSCRYDRVKLYKDGENKTFAVHRLVALTFIPNPESKEEVNHINGDKYDNSVKNLEWATRQENHAHAIKLGLSNTKNMSEARKKKIKQYNLQGEFIREWDSMSAASRYLNIPVSNMSHCKSGRIRHAGGYIWR